jgi:apolipoprotein D and lipocalin family protein
MVFQIGTRCVNATYTANTDGTVGVWNQAVNRDGQYTSIRGTARVKDAAQPAALAVTFDNPAQAGDYNVLDTDYDSYSLVYSCRKLPNNGPKFEVIWFLSYVAIFDTLVSPFLFPIYLDVRKICHLRLSIDCVEPC